MHCLMHRVILMMTALENDISFYRCKKTLRRCEVIQFTQVLSDTEFEAKIT